MMGKCYAFVFILLCPTCLCPTFAKSFGKTHTIFFIGKGVLGCRDDIKTFLATISKIMYFVGIALIGAALSSCR